VILARALGATLVAGLDRFGRPYAEVARTAPEHRDLTTSPWVRLTLDTSYWYREAYLEGSLLVLACAPLALEAHLPRCVSDFLTHAIPQADAPEDEPI
jgi:hypothetical protein